MTGAAGFIGSHLLERLLLLGQEVVALDDFSTGSHANLQAVERAVGEARWRRCEVRIGDVCDPVALRAACRGVELLLHQAALGSVPRSLAEPARTVEVNTGGTWTVLEAARAAGVARAVLASSSSVYGDTPCHPQREDELGRPLSPYAASKRAAEVVAEGLWRGLGFPTVVLRYFNVFGPRQEARGPHAAVIPRWIAALRAGERPMIHGDGGTSRDFTPVETVVQANLLAALSGPASPGRCYNVGTGRETTLLELLEMLQSSTPGAETPRHDAARGAERRASCADLTRSRSELGLEPGELESGLRYTQSG